MLSLSVQFLHLQNRNDNDTHPTGLLGGENELLRVKYFKQCLAHSKPSKAVSYYYHAKPLKPLIVSFVLSL